jgi:predicted nucleotidyltransferase component of viral defense system
MGNLLTPLQEKFLQTFFADPIGQHFFLTGGTALAAFHLHHRLSDDLDLFTLDDVALEASVRPVEQIAADLNCTLERTRVSQYFQQVLLTHPQQEMPLKIDLVRDFGPQYGKRLDHKGIIVDSLDNIAANKIVALFGRADIKDFVDLYFILQSGYDLDELFSMAQQKDRGLTEFYFVGMLRQANRQTHLPKMVKPLDLKVLQAFYAELAQQLMSRLNPEL